MNYINYRNNHCDYIETIECVKNLSKIEKVRLLQEYRKSDINGYYYLSSRATKHYYTK